MLEVTEVPDAGTVRLRLRGELDLAGAATLTKRLRALRARRAHVLLDLDELEFIDMTGLRVLLTAAEDAARDGWAFTLTRGSPPVRRLVGLVQLEGRLPFEEEAT